MGRTLAVEKLSLKNAEYVRIKIGCLDAALVPPVVSYVNIGGKFYGLEFTREISQGRVVVGVNGNEAQKGADNGDKNPQTPKRQRPNEYGGNRNVNSAPGGFMRDARKSYGDAAGGKKNILAIHS